MCRMHPAADLARNLGEPSPETCLATPSEVVRLVVAALLTLDDEHRAEVFHRFCQHCYREVPEGKPMCRCWDDS